MVKKIAYCSAMLALGTTFAALAGGPEIIPVAPAYFNGFYIGGTASGHFVSFSSDTSVVANEDIIMPSPAIPLIGSLGDLTIPAGTLLSTDSNGRAFNLYGGVQGGFGKVFNRWYVGIQGFGDWGSASSTSEQDTDSSETLAQIVTNDESSTSITTVKIENDYGVAFKPGYLITPTTMVYGKVGASWAKIKVSNSYSYEDDFSLIGDLITDTNTLAGSSSSTQTKVALLLGLGIEQYIYKDMVTFNVEYNYANYGTVDTSAPLTGTSSLDILSFPIGTPVPLTPDATTSASGKAKVSTILAGLNVYFGNNWL